MDADLTVLAANPAVDIEALADVVLTRGPRDLRQGSVAGRQERLGVSGATAPYSASSLITLIRSALPSKPMPGSSGMTMWPSSTATPSGKPP